MSLYKLLYRDFLYNIDKSKKKRGVYMLKYNVKQRYDFSCTPTAIFNERYDDINNSLCIADQDGLLGMLMADETIILPFAYDNISLIGNDLYLLIKGGKQGILHAKPVYESEKYTINIMMKTDCIYDYVSGISRFQKSFVALRKDLTNAFSYDVYVVDTGHILSGYSKVDYMDEDYVVLTDTDRRTKKYFDRYGNLIFTVPNNGECAIIVFEPFETKSGTVFVMLQADDRYLIVFVERDKKEEYKNCKAIQSSYYQCTGKIKQINVDEFLHPILAPDRFHTFDRDCALAFVVKQEGKQYLLNDCCERLSNDNFHSLRTITHVKGRTGNDLQTHLILDNQRIPLQD